MLPLAEIRTTRPESGSPLASRTVTVIVAAAIPFEATLPMDATALERVALGATRVAVAAWCPPPPPHPAAIADARSAARGRIALMAHLIAL
jgi:hypothetical protein